MSEGGGLRLVEVFEPGGDDSRVGEWILAEVEPGRECE